MSDERIQIKRYPNRRYYARNSSKYVSLQDIEGMIQEGHTVEIRDSQSGEDLTRTVLAQIILERQPEKMALFPTDMLHLILRSNKNMSVFLRDYFRQSLTYLEYLQQHSPTATALAKPMHWLKAWLDQSENDRGSDLDPAPSPRNDAELAQRVEQLEERLRQLESDRP